MMEINIDMITALVDDELNDPVQKQELFSKDRN